MKNLKLKIKKQNIILLAAAFTILVISSVVYYFVLSEHKKIFEYGENRVEVLNKKLEMLENQIKEGKIREQNNAALFSGIETANRSFYFFKDKNEFINDFSIMLNNVKGIEIYKVEYSKSDNLKQMIINIPFEGSYKAVRELLYNIECKFYFLKIEGLNVAAGEKGNLKGMVEIRAYFGDDSGEK